MPPLTYALAKYLEEYIKDVDDLIILGIFIVITLYERRM